MNEENKYYTPSYDEFCVGFEYENFVKGKGWTFRVLEDLGSQDLNEEGFCLDGDDYRVKHLDREDVVDLGWKQMGVIDCVYGFTITDRFHLAFDEHSKRVIINDHEKTLIDCKIKNKSELKKIMKMLQII